MIVYEVTPRTIEDKVVVAIICDKCKKEYHIEDIGEFQEFHYIRHTCGYDSIFGDDSIIECDICQHCLMRILDGAYRIVEGE
jgi:hypothetical protein